MNEIDEYLKDLPKETQEKKRWKNLSGNSDGHYFISAYEKGDDYSAPFWLCSDLQDVVKTVERNDCDWRDNIYNYAIVWKIQSSSYFDRDKTEIIGVYRIEESDDLTEEQGWIDYEVTEELDREKHMMKYKLIFDGIELEITEKTGPAYARAYKKNRLLSGYYLY